MGRGLFFGSVVLSGEWAVRRREEIERRIRNVADRPTFNQPERRLVGVRRAGPGLEVRTTSQRLAHRIAHELAKAFGGQARYAWSDREGALLATWASG